MNKMKPTTRPLQADEDRLVSMLKALGNPARFQIIQYLAERQACICGEIVESTTLAQSTVSQHLKVLREAGLIMGEVDGPATCYCLDVENIRWLRDQVNDWFSPVCADGLCGNETNRK